MLFLLLYITLHNAKSTASKNEAAMLKTALRWSKWLSACPHWRYIHDQESSLMVTGQLADMPTHGLPTCGLGILWTRRLLNSRTGQVADWTTCGSVSGDRGAGTERRTGTTERSWLCWRQLCVHSFRFLPLT